MTRMQIMLCSLLAMPVMAGAQVVTPEQPSSGAGTAPGAQGASGTGDAGAVVVPPKMDPAAIATPPKRIDPKMDDATAGVDARNRQKSQDQQLDPKPDTKQGKRKGQPVPRPE